MSVSEKIVVSQTDYIVEIKDDSYRPRYRKGNVISLNGSRNPAVNDSLAFRNKTGNVVFVDFEDLDEQCLKHEYLGVVDYIDLRNKNAIR